MDNNMDNKDFEADNREEIENGDALKENEAPAEAEHVLSFRDEDAGKIYHMTGDQLVKDHVSSKETPPAYNVPRTDGVGNISYVPSNEPKTNTRVKQKKNSGLAGRIVLVAVCVFLSLGCGFFGAFFGNIVGGFVDGGADNTDNGEVLQDRITAIEDEIADLEGKLDDPSTENKGEIEAAIEDLREELKLLKNGNQVVVVERPVNRVDTSAGDSGLTYADVAATVGDSVVAITTEYKVVSFWQEYVTGGAGSGVVMSADGYIITNYHVVSSEGSYSSNEFADSVKVSFENGREYDAVVIGGSASADIAVLKITPASDHTLVPAMFADSDNLKVGEEVIAIGNPLGELSGTTTNGIISALAREVVIEGVTMNLLQTNAAVNPGNSGGGLFNMKGELIGVVNAKSSGEGIEGLGFAIPSNDALAVAKDIIENGGTSNDTPTVKVGIEIVTIQDAASASEFGVNAFGVYVSRLEEGYNDKVLKLKDRIIAVDGEEIVDGNDVVEIVRASEAGDKLEFTIYRSGKLKTVEVTVYPYN